MRSPGSRRDHDRFCQVEGWTETRNARGKTVAHHITYEVVLPDGRILRTRVSRPADNTTYGAGLSKHILDEQLIVTADEFWDCVSNKSPPHRGTSIEELQTNALPASLVHQLIHEAGIPEDEIAGMTLQQATEVMVTFWSRPRG